MIHLSRFFYALLNKQNKKRILINGLKNERLANIIMASLIFFCISCSLLLILASNSVNSRTKLKQK